MSRVQPCTQAAFQRPLCAAITLFGSCLTLSVHAETKVLEEIIVTSQKREQSLQDVPMESKRRSR